MDKIDIAYNDFRASVNNIIANEQQNCNKALNNNNMNNNKYMDSIDNLVVSLQNYRGIPKYYSPEKPSYITTNELDVNLLTQPTGLDAANTSRDLLLNAHNNLLNTAESSTPLNSTVSSTPLIPTTSSVQTAITRSQKNAELSQMSCANLPKIDTADSLHICIQKCGKAKCLQKFDNTLPTNLDSRPGNLPTDPCMAIKKNPTKEFSCQQNCDCYALGSTPDPKTGRLANVSGNKQECVVGQPCEGVICKQNNNSKKTITNTCIL